MKVLLVDDEPDILEQAKTFLEKEKDELDVETAASVEDAYDLLDENRYDGIVSDYQLGEVDGLDFLKSVREEMGSDIPFIVFTGRGREEVAMDALNLGADRYLQKRGDPKSQYSVLADAIVQEVESWKVKTELEKARSETQMLLDNYPNMIFFVSKEGRFLRVNKTFSDSVNRSKREIEGRMLDDLFTREQAERMMEDNRKVIESEEPKLDIVEPYETPDGTCWRQTDKFPLSGEDGNIAGVIGFAQDITERRKVEEREEFLHSLLRHDVANKAQIAQGYLELLEDTDLSENQRELVDKSMKATMEAEEIIEKVRTLRDIEEERVGDVRIDFLILGIVEENGQRIRERGFIVEVDCKLSCLVKGGALLRNAFTNLIENSLRHSQGSEIKISLEDRGEEVACIVEDDGKGIPAGDREKVFDKGFKRGESSSSGLGLYLVREIAEGYGGSVEVKESELGGARFDVLLKKA